MDWYTDAFGVTGIQVDWYTYMQIYRWTGILVFYETLSLCHKLNFVHILCHNQFTLFITLLSYFIYFVHSSVI